MGPHMPLAAEHPPGLKIPIWRVLMPGFDLERPSSICTTAARANKVSEGSPSPEKKRSQSPAVRNLTPRIENAYTRPRVGYCQRSLRICLPSRMAQPPLKSREPRLVRVRVPPWAPDTTPRSLTYGRSRCREGSQEDLGDSSGPRQRDNRRCGSQVRCRDWVARDGRLLVATDEGRFPPAVPPSVS